MLSVISSYRFCSKIAIPGLFFQFESDKKVFRSCRVGSQNGTSAGEQTVGI